MRILIVNQSRRKVAGIEDYLAKVIPALARSGHDLAFVYEVDSPPGREVIPLPAAAPTWSLSDLGIHRTIESMKEWGPDLIYAHGPLDLRFEAAFLNIAPAIYFTHNYYGTCISGLKTFKFPVTRPCNRRFGPACLLHYLPRRCGGRNPITMLKLFRRESQRLANLQRYRAIVTHSSHMRTEYIHNGLPPSQVQNFLPGLVKARLQSLPRETRVLLGGSGVMKREHCWNLLFVGRIEVLKGGTTLLDALPNVTERLGPIRLVLAGEGPAKDAWEKKASKLQAQHAALQFEFTGWLDRRQLNLIYADTHLLVVPSLWPEPFGRIGPEAGLHGIPAAAFDVGGISDWLINGVNGYLAPGDPPTASGLADAIVQCLQDIEIYQELRAGAVTVASQFSLEHHLEALYEVFNRVVPTLV